jgi:hypothetical protein
MFGDSLVSAKTIRTLPDRKSVFPLIEFLQLQGKIMGA